MDRGTAARESKKLGMNTAVEVPSDPTEDPTLPSRTAGIRLE
jgi:hypothetical protein